MLQAHQHQGWAFTLDATPSTYDTRSQLWVFGLCVHVTRAGQLQRLGAITGAPDSPQTKTRALKTGLVALAKHTCIAVKVIVQVAAVWEAWTEPRHRAQHQDLYQGLTDEDFHRITVLYISRNTRTPDTPGNEPHLRRRQRDAALAAWERATQFQNKKAAEWQTTLDQDHETIYRHAAARLAVVSGQGALPAPKTKQTPRAAHKTAQKAPCPALREAMAGTLPQVAATQKRLPVQCLWNQGPSGTYGTHHRGKTRADMSTDPA